jgi:hypothetical protein
MLRIAEAIRPFPTGEVTLSTGGAIRQLDTSAPHFVNRGSDGVHHLARNRFTGL